MTRMEKKRWSDLSDRQRKGMVAAGVVQLGLLTAALTDLRKRPATQIRGPKKLWLGVSFLNTVGPIAYFALGRRR